MARLHQVKLSLLPEEYDRWQAAAKADDRPLAAWVRWLVNEVLVGDQKNDPPPKGKS